MTTDTVCLTWLNRSFRLLAWISSVVVTPVVAGLLITAPGVTWWIGAISGALVGTIGSVVWAVYGITDVSLCAKCIVVRNPFRTLKFSVGAVAAIEANDRVEFHLADGTVVRAWAVQAANMSLILKRRSHVDRVADEIRVAVASVVDADETTGVVVLKPHLRFFPRAIVGGAVLCGVVGALIA